MNLQKGNLYLIIAIIVGVVAIGATGFASWKYFGGGSELEKNGNEITKPLIEKETEKSEIVDEKADLSSKASAMEDWKTYKNQEYGYEIKYPKNWKLAEVNKNPFNMTIWEGDGLNKDNIQMVEVYGFVSRGSIEGNLDYLRKRLKTEFNKMKEISITNGRGFYWINETKGGGPSPSIYLVGKNHLFLMTYNIFDDTGNVLVQSELIFNQMISTFKFIETNEISNWKSYRNTKYGYEVKYPKDWYMDTTYSENDFTQRGSKEDDDFIGGDTVWSNYQNPGQYNLGTLPSDIETVYLLIYKTDTQTTLDNFIKEKGFSYYKKENIRINGVSGIQLIGSPEDLTKTSKIILLKTGNKVFDFSHGRNSIESAIVFDQMLSTFKFTEADKTTSLKILSPNDGEKWKIGNSYLIRWNSVGSIPQVKIYLVPVNSNIGIRDISYGPIVNTDSYTYGIPYCGPGHECSSNFEIPKGKYYIRITDSKGVVSDQSDASFSIISN